MKYNPLTPIRMIAVDLDGTLLKKDKTISERTLKAITACRAKGIKFIFATGRSQTHAKAYLELLMPDAAVLAYGAHVMADGKTVFRRCMSPVIAQKVLDGARSAEKIRYQLATGECYSTEPAENEKILELDRLIPSRIEHLCAWNFPKESAERLTKKCGCSLSQTVGDAWCNFSAKGVSKGAGVRRVMRLYGFKKGEAVAFGDESCDAEIFKACGIGVAMGNADEVARAKADYVTENNDCDGIAVFLEEYILK